MSQEHQIERKRTLTDSDLVALAKVIRQQQQEHLCRFDNITPEDMDFIKDLLGIYKETRSEFIKWLVRGIIYGSLIVLALAGYFKASGKGH